MKRTELKRKTPLKAKKRLESKPQLVTRKKKLERGSSLLRKTPLKAKRRRPKPGDDPKYKAWIKTQPCVVGGKRCGKVHPHHMINGDGDARKGMAQTAPDRFLLPLCSRHHRNFHDGKGFCQGWDEARRKTFQEDEVFRLRAIWRDLQELDVLQEPTREAC